MQTSHIVLFGAATLFVVTTVHADSNKTGSNGRYEGVAASPNAVWVVDTRTGRVRKCTQEFADQTPVCSELSN